MLLAADGRNECGGTRPLGRAIGELCDAGLGRGHGHVQCDGPDIVWCAPYTEDKEECAVCKYKGVADTRTGELRALTDRVFACQQICDARGGVCSYGGECVCFPGWGGENCGERDCGKFGIEKDGECVCNTDWAGDACDVYVGRGNEAIERKNGRETAGRMECHDGWTGDACDRCASDAVCVPTHDAEHPYALALVPPAQQTEEFFSPSPALTKLYHGRRPFRPVSPYACDCTTEETTDEDPDYHHSSAKRATSQQRYMHDHYEHHYVANDVVYNGLLAVAIVLVLIGVIFMFFCVKYAPKRQTRKSRTREQTLPPTPPPQQSASQSRDEIVELTRQDAPVAYKGKSGIFLNRSGNQN